MMWKREANDSHVVQSQPVPASKQNPYSWIVLMLNSYSDPRRRRRMGARRDRYGVRGSPRGEQSAKRGDTVCTLAKRFGLDTAVHGRTVPVHTEMLRACGIKCTEEHVSARRGLTEAVEYRIQSMLEHNVNRVLNNGKFLIKFVHARKVCSYTADDVIHKLEKTEISPEDALQVIDDHSREIAYILMGRKCPVEQAEAVQERLEPGRRKYSIVNTLAQDKNRLRHNAMCAMRYHPHLMLMEVERSRTPYAVGFTRPTILERSTLACDTQSTDRCLLHFIDGADFLGDGKDRFFEAIAGRTFAIFFIVIAREKEGETSSIQSMVASVNHIVNSGVACYSLQVQHYVEKSPGASEGWTRQDSAYNAIMIAGSTRSAWQKPTLDAHMKRFHIRSSINNEQMRRLMNDAPVPRDHTADENKYNIVHAHSGTPNVIEVLANLALNRIACSLTGEALVKFKEDLVTAQEARTKHGETIAPPPKEINVPKRRRKSKLNPGV